MPSVNQQLNTSDSGSHLARWIVIAVLAAAAVVGVVLLVTSSSRGGASPSAPTGGRGTSFTSVDLTGDYTQGSGFNVNGIDATKNGKTLLFVQSNSGKLFTTGANGVARAIVLAGGESVPNGDGILLDGKTLYVVQNSMDVVAKIALSPNLRSGRVLRRISDTRNLDFPTTIAEQGSRLYAVNARFDLPSPDAATPYWVTKLPK